MRASLLCLLLIASACKGKEPVAPPAQEGASSQPRTDGVYASKANGDKPGWDLLRFLANGRVTSISTTGAIEAAAAVLYEDENDDAGAAARSSTATGAYEVKDGVLRFTMKSKLGEVEYAGAVKGDRLNVRWHSSINDATQEEAFSFVAVSEEGADKDNAGAADAGAAAAEADDASPGAAASSADLDAGASTPAATSAKPDAGRPKRRPQKR
jgi:hypothetical protein